MASESGLDLRDDLVVGQLCEVGHFFRLIFL